MGSLPRSESGVSERHTPFPDRCVVRPRGGTRAAYPAGHYMKPSQDNRGCHFAYGRREVVKLWT